MVLGCVVNVYYSNFHLVSLCGTLTMKAEVEVKNQEFTAEICEDFDDKTSRCGLKINHTFYEKPMMKQFLLHISLPAIAVL